MKKYLLALAAILLLASSFLGACSSNETAKTGEKDNAPSEIIVTENFEEVQKDTTVTDTTSKEKTETAAKQSVTVVDSAGRIVEVPYPVERVIFTYSQTLLMAKAVGVGDEQIVGLDEFTHGQYKDTFTGLADKPTVGKNLFNLDVEKLISLEPQVLISTTSTLTRNPDLEAQLEKVGIKFIGLDFELENVKDIIKILGGIFGNEDRAEDYSEFWFEQLDQVERKVATLSDTDKKRVYWENTAAGYVTISSSSAAHEIVERAGGYNIGRNLEGGSPEVDPEWVLTQDPDVIMQYPMGADYQGGFGTTDTASFAAIREAIKARPGFSQLRAVQDDEVYICSQIIKTGAFENVAICYIAKILYPELFTDMDPLAMMRETVETYLGLDWSVMNGVFVYPDPLKE